MLFPKLVIFCTVLIPTHVRHMFSCLFMYCTWIMLESRLHVLQLSSAFCYHKPLLLFSGSSCLAIYRKAQLVSRESLHKRLLVRLNPRTNILPLWIKTRREINNLSAVYCSFILIEHFCIYMQKKYTSALYPDSHFH